MIIGLKVKEMTYSVSSSAIYCAYCISINYIISIPLYFSVVLTSAIGYDRIYRIMLPNGWDLGYLKVIG